MSFYDLPSEVVHQILIHIEPTSLPILELVSKQFANFANLPILWQYHCRVRFSYWNSARNIKERFADNVANTNWKVLYSERYRIDQDVSRGIDSMLSTQTSRMQKSAMIVEIGQEARDTLLRQCNVADDAEDVLARRWDFNPSIIISPLC